MARTLRVIGVSDLAGTVEALLLNASTYVVVETIELTETSTGIWEGTVTAAAASYVVRLTDDNGFQGAWEQITLTAVDGTTFTVRDAVNAEIIGGDATLAKQEEILAAIAALNVGAGTGPNAVTFTITDDSEPANDLQGVTVGVFDGPDLAAIATTDASGEATVNLDNGTYSVRCTKDGYQLAAQAFTAPGSDPTYEMTRLIPPASTVPDTVTARYICHDEDRLPAAGIVVQLRAYSPADDETGRTYSGSVETQVSIADGYAYFANLVVGATYQVRRGTRGKWTPVIVGADEGGGTVELESVVETHRS